MSRLSKRAIDELLASMPNPETPDDRNRFIMQLQRKVATQQKCIEDLSRAVTRLQQQLYFINQPQSKQG